MCLVLVRVRFSRGYMGCDTRSSLPSVQPTEICTQETQHHFPHGLAFCTGRLMFIFKKRSLLTHKRLVITIFKYVSVYFLKGSLLISNIVNVEG